MSRPLTQVNPLRAERVKTIIQREKLTQQEFAAKTFQSQQNVSRILNLKCALTEETARAIVKAFPAYRLSWLLGFDDDMTELDGLKKLIHGTVDAAVAINQAIRAVADDICNREDLPRQDIPAAHFAKLHAMLHDYAELILADYIKNREKSRIWRGIE